jgi:putative AlgH/UPF0301 family transcriptional regulator
MAANIWLNLPASSDLLFGIESDDIWARPMRPLALIQRIMLPMQAQPRQRAAPPNHHST